MPPFYFETRFLPQRNRIKWPRSFCILTAWATTGEVWTMEDNLRANQTLLSEIQARESWHEPLTGFSPSTGHAEPGWAVEMKFDDACELGQQFRQDAIYLVSDDELSVSYCDARRQLVYVGKFVDRLENLDA